MNKFKEGDKVNIYDSSYIFGIQKGRYKGHCHNFEESRSNLTVINMGLNVAKLKDDTFSLQNCLSGEFSAVNDLLVTDNNGNFWFTQSRFCEPVEPNHHIVIDGHGIVLSHKSFLALREQLI